MADPYAQFADHVESDPYAQFADHTDTPPVATPAAQPQSWGDWLKQAPGQLANQTIRAGVKAVAAPGLMAEDFGVGLRNLYGKVTGGQSDFEYPSDIVNKALDTYTQAPTTTAGKVGEFASSAILGAGLPVPTGIGSLRSAITGAPLPNAVPSNFVPTATPLQRNLAETRGEGYVFPPATTNPSIKNKIIESFGGKIGTQQDASALNMSTTNALARRAVGLEPEADITPDALQRVRAAADVAKQNLVAKIGPAVNMDQQFSDNVSQIVAPFRKAGEALGSRFGNNPLVDAADAINRPKLEPDVALTAVRTLRDEADVAFRAGQGSTGKAYKALATNIEDAMDRHLVAQGDQGAVNAYRDARVLQAKSFDVEKALNDSTGNVDASFFGSKLKRGGYLSDELLTIGKAARIAPKAMQSITDSGSVRNTDVALGLGSTILGHNPALLAYPFARQSARAYMLSAAGQSALGTPGLPTVSPGLAGLSQSLIAQWDLAK